jgi:citrate lyase subunit beta / citryl-CoA lyase
VRSKLFVPASRPELFDKALAGAADAVSFDLEDAVDASRKAEARQLLVQHMGGRPRSHGKLLVLRVNPVGSADFQDDLRAAVQSGMDVVNLPKVNDAADVVQAAASLDQYEREHGAPRAAGLLVNVETPRGLRLAATLAAAHPRVVGLQIGFGDLFSALGIAQDEAGARQQVRLAVRLAAGEAGLPAYDGAFVHLDDSAGFTAEAQAAQRLGFAGKSCIHPSQVPLANAAFRPAAAEVEHALRVVAGAAEAAARGVGAFVVDGRLVDGPFITRAEQTVAIARRLGLVS